jgi:hypothetical protein
MTLLYIYIMFLVILSLVYFDYIPSIARMTLYSHISSYSVHLSVPWVDGREHVSMVLRYYLPADTPYIPGSVVDRGSDYHPVESFVVHSSNIGTVGPGCEGSNLALFLIFLSNVPCV